MNINPRQIALGLATLVMAPTAFALTPAQIAAGPTTYVWLSGSSSLQNSVFRSVIALCNGIAGNAGTNDVHIYMIGTGEEPGVGGGSRTAYACTMSAAAGVLLSGKKVVVYHSIEGNSFGAYSPHLRMAGDPNPNLQGGSLFRINDLAFQGGTAKCGARTPAVSSIDIDGVAYNIGRYNGCDVIAKTFNASTKGDAAGLPGQSYPDGGFSDMEYSIIKQNLGISNVLSTIGSEVATNIGLAFGVAVSYPLYYQLQKNDIAKGDIAASCTAAPFTSIDPNLTPACQPNMSSQRYSTIASKDTIGTVDGRLFGGTAGSTVKLVQRRPISGAQSASGIRLLTTPCASGVSGGGMIPARSTDSTATAIVTEEQDSNFVKNALTAASGADQFALGIMSMEYAPIPNALNPDYRWAFVKLDGISPNADPKQRTRAMDGTYDFWYELVAFTASGSISPASSAGSALITAATQKLGSIDLRGVFSTPAAGSSGPTSKGSHLGNACRPLTQ